MFKKQFSFLFLSSLAVIFLQACAGNGFHLRNNVDLPTKFQQIQIENLNYNNDFVKVFEEALEESGGKLVTSKSSRAQRIKINNFREGKRIIAYTSERKAREFLLSLKFDYTLIKSNKNFNKNTNKDSSNTKNYRINLDRVFIYDADFALGKAEEENQIKQALYKEAARLMLLKLQYSKGLD